MEKDTQQSDRWTAMFMQTERKRTGRCRKVYGLYDLKHGEYVVTGTKREMEKLAEKFNA